MSCPNNRCTGNCTCTPQTPTPFYQNVQMCPEDNRQYINVDRFYFSLNVPMSWNIPLVGGSATLTFPGVRSVAIGSYIWNPNFGYYEIVGIDLQRQEIVIQNNGDIGPVPNAAVGTEVPACTGFTVTDPPCCSGGDTPGNCDFVAIDFTAPAVDTCIDITVTSVLNLVIGKVVQIGAGRYTLSNVLSDTLITICNEGDGITPGSPVIAKNTAGQYQYCVTPLDTNPCNNPAVTQGSLLVCSDGLQQPLHGDTLGSIPVLVDVDTNEVKFQILGVPVRTCSTLTADLTIINGTPSYTIIVSDSSVFNIGDLLQIGTRTDRVTVTGLPNTTTIEGDISPVPSLTVVVPAGTTICNVDCCEELQAQIDDLGPIIEAQCIAQVANGTVPLAIGGAFIVAISLDGSGFQQATLSSNLQGLNLPESCDYLVFATLSVAALLDFIADDPAGPILSEIFVELTPNNTFPNTQTMGKMVWTESEDDGKDIGGFPATPVPAPASCVWNELESPEPALPIMYHQNDITAIGYVTGGNSLTLPIKFRTLVGDNKMPTDYTSARFMVSGLLWYFRK